MLASDWPVASSFVDLAGMRPRTATDVVDFGFELCRSQARPLAFLSIALALPLQVAIEGRALLADRSGCLSTRPGSCAPPVWPTVILAVLIAVAAAIGLAAGAVIVGEACLGRVPAWRRALLVATRRLPTLVGVLVLTIAGVGVGLAVFVIPGLVVAGVWSLAVPAVMLEDAGVVASLRRSSRLVSGQWGRVTGAVVLTGGLVVVLSTVVAGLFRLVILVPGARTATAGMVLAVTQRTLIAVVGLPPLAAVLAAIYTDARVRREGLDMQQAIDWLSLGQRSPGITPAAPTPFAPVPHGRGSVPGGSISGGFGIGVSR